MNTYDATTTIWFPTLRNPSKIQDQFHKEDEV